MKAEPLKDVAVTGFEDVSATKSEARIDSCLIFVAVLDSKGFQTL